MADNKKGFYIRAEGTLVEVTEAVYRIYYGMNRQAKTQIEKDMRNGKILYSNLDTSELLAEETIPDRDAAPVEDVVVDKLMVELLYTALDQLPAPDRKIVFEIYFKGHSERELAKRLGISQVCVHKRKQRALGRIRKIMKM